MQKAMFARRMEYVTSLMAKTADLVTTLVVVRTPFTKMGSAANNVPQTKDQTSFSTLLRTNGVVVPAIPAKAIRWIV